MNRGNFNQLLGHYPPPCTLLPDICVTKISVLTAVSVASPVINLRCKNVNLLTDMENNESTGEDSFEKDSPCCTANHKCFHNIQECLYKYAKK